MGNKCCADSHEEHEIGAPIGLETDGVTEDFQYHETHLKERKIKFDKYDKFYREIAYPMHYLCVGNFMDDIKEL